MAFARSDLPRVAVFSRGAIRVQRLVTGAHRTNAYVLCDARRALLVDPAAEAEALIAMVQTLGLAVAAILLTHAHWDHVGAAADVQDATGAPVILHSAEMRLLRMAPTYARTVDKSTLALPHRIALWQDGSDCVTDLEREVDVLSIPGHTRGGVALRIHGMVFTGDTLLRDRAGSAKAPFGDSTALTESLGRLGEWLTDDDLVLPGHGAEWTGSAARQWITAHLARHPAAAVDA